jgi:hypothetical protein
LPFQLGILLIPECLILPFQLGILLIPECLIMSFHLDSAHSGKFNFAFSVGNCAFRKVGLYFFTSQLRIQKVLMVNSPISRIFSNLCISLAFWKLQKSLNIIYFSNHFVIYKLAAHLARSLAIAVVVPYLARAVDQPSPDDWRGQGANQTDQKALKAQSWTSRMRWHGPEQNQHARHHGSAREESAQNYGAKEEVSVEKCIFFVQKCIF